MSIAELTANNGSFSKEIPGLQIVWDSTSLGLFKECPRKYYYSLIEGWTGGRGNVHLIFGDLVHKALEFFDHQVASGMDYDEAVHETVRHSLIISTETKAKVVCNDCGEASTVVLRPIGQWKEQEVSHVSCPSCGGDAEVMEVSISPWVSDMNEKTRFTFVRAIAWYLEHFKEDHAHTVILSSGKPAVELTFKLPTEIESLEGTPYFLAGHMDRVVEYNDELWVMDRKTTKTAFSSSFFDGFNPDNQMSLYTIAGKVIFDLPIRGVLIDGIQSTVNFSRFARGFSMRTDRQNEEWMRGLSYWLRQAEGCAEEEEWPMNDKSCSMYGGCPFRQICSKDPAVRGSFLKSNFERRIWDPTVAR